MNVEQVEASIVARLQQKINNSGVIIIPLPEVQADYTKPFVNGRITVAYAGSTYMGASGTVTEGHLSSGIVVQDWAMDFELSFEARKLRGNLGVHDLIHRARLALIGWRPGGAGKISAVTDRFGSFEDNLWLHSLTIRTHARLIEKPDAAEEPLITRITASDPGGLGGTVQVPRTP